MESIIKHIKNEIGNDERVLDDDYGIVLDSCYGPDEDNIAIYTIFVQNECLYGATNYGIMNLEKTLTDIDDWYTIEDIVFLT